MIVVQLLAGMFIGTVVVSMIWFFTIKSNKNKEEKTRREREEIMHSIGKIVSEIDEMFLSLKLKKLSIEQRQLKEVVLSKTEAINRLLKPHLHLMDVYYVKYIETLINEYNRAAEMGQQPKGAAFTSESSANEMETDIGFIDQKETIDSSMSGVALREEFAVTESGAEGASTENSKEMGISDKIFDFAKDEEQFATETQIFFPGRSVDNGIITDKTQELVGDFSASIDTKLVSADQEKGKLLDQKEEALKEETEEPGYLEIKEAPTTYKEEQSFFEEKFPDEKNKNVASEVYTKDKEIIETAKDSSVIYRSSSEKESEAALVGEEDFTMETLMDVDLHTISPFLKDQTHEKSTMSPNQSQTSLFEVSIQEEEKRSSAAGKPEDLEVIIASNVSHTETNVQQEARPVTTDNRQTADDEIDKRENKEKDSIPEETTYTCVEGGAEAGEEKEAADTFEMTAEQIPFVKSSSSDQMFSSRGVTDADLEAFDREEEILTGEDVAEKIASLEVHKLSSETVKPEKEKKKGKTVSIKKETEKSPPHSKKKSSGHVRSKDSSEDETITGDDVADKIDKFFGLLEK